MTTLLTTSTPTVPSPGTLTEATTAVTAAKITVDAYANAVINQPALHLDKLPDLAGHLTTAQGNATTWVEHTSPELVNRITDVIGFGDIWAAFMPTVRQKVKHGKKADVVQLLQIMRDNHLQPLEQAAKDSAAAVSSLGVAFAADDGNFTTDLQLGTSVYEGDQGVIAQLQKANSDLQNSMSHMMTLMAGSATAIVVGGLIVAVGALAEIPTAGASTVVVAAGVVVAGAGIAGVVTGAVEYNKELKHYRENLTTIAQDQAEMGVLTAMQGQISSLAAANEQAQNALQTLANSWTTVKGYFDNMIKDINGGISEYVVVLEELKAADLQWSRLTATAAALANNLGVSHVQVDTAQPTQAVVTDTAAA
ncbi:alpha-helical pore-forming toxin family protein [Actinoplanes sp. N902-109]|uniref:alpha-helical pore-forming toxin family protein n=1 Tax=Actinoplanes sp. (strain N902-109) TaxID=649831 RepID=UPI0003293B0F|nr:alpha-helical pore-forming toxin family protein [Actinoplanes sp. N902-109]AGL16220.1 hypothetical protein L083_2710 [Actinoplanes sp. N902-109]